MADSKPTDGGKQAGENETSVLQNIPIRRGPLPLEIPIIQHLNSKRVILASASPRRKALLQQVRSHPWQAVYPFLTGTLNPDRSQKPRNPPVDQT